MWRKHDTLEKAHTKEDPSRPDHTVMPIQMRAAKCAFWIFIFLWRYWQYRYWNNLCALRDLLSKSIMNFLDLLNKSLSAQRCINNLNYCIDFDTVNKTILPFSHSFFENVCSMGVFRTKSLLNCHTSAHTGMHAHTYTSTHTLTHTHSALSQCSCIL